MPTIDPEEILPETWRAKSPEEQKMLMRAIKYNWSLWARDNQRVDWEDEDWDILLVLAGRGYGKTRMGAEAVREFCKANPGARVAVCAPTLGAARDVCFEGESGLLEVCSEDEIGKEVGGKYNRSLGQLRFANGSLCTWYSGGDPEKFRGPQHHLIWADELCAWPMAQEVWDMMLMGLRLGAHPRILITTTPKPSPLIIELVKRAQEGDKSVKIVTGSTFDNAANLPASALEALRLRYEGTTLGRQELYAELILDSPGALWSREAIEINRVTMEDAPEMTRIIVAVDPAMSAKGDRVAETGIIVAGVGTDNHGYVLEDATMENATPDQWANQVVAKYHAWNADKIVFERNQGGDLIRHTFQTIDDRLPLKAVVASKGKAVRAEPVSALYEQGRVHHIGVFQELEDQLCVPAGTLIDTARGRVPIEDVRVGTQVWTRDGLRDVMAAGQTGTADQLVVVTHKHGCVVSTPWHPILTLNRGFVPAQSVRATDLLAVDLSRASTDHRLRGEAVGTTAWHVVTTGTPRVSFFTERSTRHITGRSLPGSMSTTLTKTRGTTRPATSWPSPRSSTLQNTIFGASPHSWETLPIGRFTPSGSGTGGGTSLPESVRALSAERSSVRPALMAASVLGVAVVELSTSVPVYNLTVAETPEYVADGVLIHNCFWAPNEGNARTNSPDRLDALVWAFTELMLHGGGGEVNVPWGGAPSSGGGGDWGGFAIPRM